MYKTLPPTRRTLYVNWVGMIVSGLTLIAAVYVLHWVFMGLSAGAVLYFTYATVRTIIDTPHEIDV